jgi:hypothetical protein
MTRLWMATELSAAILLVAVSALTLVWPDWIEGLLGLDPDAGSGAAETGLVCVCAIGAAALWYHRRLTLRRVAQTVPSHSAASPPGRGPTLHKLRVPVSSVVTRALGGLSASPRLFPRHK